MSETKSIALGILRSSFLMIICSLQSAQADSYTLQVLHNFQSNSPSSLVSAPSGGFYGSTFGGTIFRANNHGEITTLVSFAADPSGLIVGKDGSIYGVTTFEFGGSGSVFSVSPDGTVSVLHVFGGEDGVRPWGKLLQGLDGNLYGTTTFGGSNDLGTVFQVSTDGRSFSSLYSFTWATGYQPIGSLVQTADGCIYGTTSLGEETIYKISPIGNLTIITNLYSVTGSGLAPLTLAHDGSIWAITSSGGIHGRGAVLKLLTNDLLTLVASFGPNDGSMPRGLIEGADGTFYGVTGRGGKYGLGTVFKISAQGALSTIADFDQSTGAPYGPLAQGTNGQIYGVAMFGGQYGSGTLFRLVGSLKSQSNEP